MKKSSIKKSVAIILVATVGLFASSILERIKIYFPQQKEIRQEHKFPSTEERAKKRFGEIKKTTVIKTFESKYAPVKIKGIRCSKILHKTAFDICYSCGKKHPVAVMYKLKGNLVDSENLSRSGLSFRPDYSLETKCRSYSKDYSNTGFDRGHLAPNAAFDYDRKVQKETFLMSNIAPQKPKLNRYAWSKIERFARMKALEEGEVSVITGVCGSKGKIRNKVNIPAYWYKIIFTKNGPVAFISENTNFVSKKAKDHLFSIERIEQRCGISFEIDTLPTPKDGGFWL